MKIPEIEEPDLFLLNMVKFRILPLMTMPSKRSHELNLSEDHYMVLIKLLKTTTPILVSTIADSLFITRSKASRITTDLEKLGFIKRNYAKMKDRRKVDLQMTKKGHEFTMEYARDIIGFLSEVYEELGAKKIELLGELLGEFNEIARRSISELIYKE